MIEYTCDNPGCRALMVFKEYNKKSNIIDGSHFCHSCRKKAKTIIQDLKKELLIKNEEVRIWYNTEKSNRLSEITIQAVGAQPNIEIKEGGNGRRTDDS